jgi:tetratricopeptide (TPR) repeat protein
MERNRESRRTVLICGMLGALTLGAFWPVVHHGFIRYDDPVYVTENARVLAGLSWDNVDWAFCTGEGGNWHPLTWLSHMLDVKIFGLNAGRHHLINLLLHTINTLLVFLVLKRMTRTFWPCAVVAALFAVHPLHVESVAWVAERKDVLSTFFFMLTLWAYAGYADKSEVGPEKKGGGRKPNSGVQSAAAAPEASRATHLPSPIFHLPSPTSYVLALIFFALGLMSKPMLVTLPFLLLLLDFWPLGRFGYGDSQDPDPKLKVPSSKFRASASFPSATRLLLEKVPFLCLAAASSIITVLVQAKGGAVSSLQALSFSARASNAVASYLKYLGKMVWPADLAIFYPHPALSHLPSDEWAVWQYGAAVLVLAGVCGLAWIERTRRPWLLVGWLWYLGTLVPVIGIVQAGTQAMADRYTYIPLIGIFIAVVFTLSDIFLGPNFSLDLSRKAHSPGAPLAAALLALGVAMIGACVFVTHQQVKFWRDDFALFEHALAVNARNAPAHVALATAYGRQGKYGFALVHARAAIDADANSTGAWQTLGDVDAAMGKPEVALGDYQRALRIDQNLPYTWFSLGSTYAKMGKAPEAIQNYQEALLRKPHFAAAHNNLAGVFWTAGKREEALKEFAEAVRCEPESPERRYSLGKALAQQGKTTEATVQFAEALRLKPDYVEALAAWGGMLAMEGKLPEAQALFLKIVALRPNEAQGHLKLGSLYLMAGQTNQAAAAFGEALRIEPNLAREAMASGKSLINAGQLDAALSSFTTAVWLQPENAEAQSQLGLLLARRGKLDEATFHFSEALRLAPGAQAHYNLALALGMTGKFQEAITHYQASLKLKPDSAAALNDLAWILATAPQAEIRNGTEAVRLAERACELSGGRNAGFQGTLGAAYAEAGRFADAISATEKGRDLALAGGDKAQVEKANARLGIYREGKPCRE